MKTCSVCSLNKCKSEFQVRLASKDGLTAACGVCLANRDKARYLKERDYRLSKMKIYSKTDAGKKAHSAANKKWQEQNALRRAAHVLLNNALKNGRITKTACFTCGEEKVEAHHADYSNPLGVIWLCAKHHKDIHHDRSE